MFQQKSVVNLKTFLVINLSYFGDVLLTNSLCQAIKQEYPESKVVFLVNKPFYEAAKYQKDVDDVLYFDKCGVHRGFLGLLKFILTCKYRNKIDTAFIMYANDRGVLISFGLGAKERISSSSRISSIFLTKKSVEVADFVHTQDHNAAFIGAVTNKLPLLLL